MTAIPLIIPLFICNTDVKAIFCIFLKFEIKIQYYYNNKSTNQSPSKNITVQMHKFFHTFYSTRLEPAPGEVGGA